MKKIIALLTALLMLGCTAACGEEQPVFHAYTLSSCGYSLQLLWQEGIEEDLELRDQIFNLFLTRYPAIRETFGTTENRTIKLHLINEDQTYTVSTGNDHSYFTGYSQLKDGTRKLNTLVSFFAHQVTTGHPNPDNHPEIDVLSNGLKHYIEVKYAADPSTAIWLMPYEEGQQLTNHAQIAGAFIKWLADTYGAEIPVRLNRVLHEGCYSQDFWLTALGNTLENLWNEYASQSAVQ